MDLSVTFTINFAYVLYPILAILIAWVIAMLYFTVMMASANAKKASDWFGIVGRMLFRPSCFVITLHWVSRDVLGFK